MDDRRLPHYVMDEVMALPSLTAIRRVCALREKDLRTDLSALIADVLEMYEVRLDAGSLTYPKLRSI